MEHSSRTSLGLLSEPYRHLCSDLLSIAPANPLPFSLKTSEVLISLSPLCRELGSAWSPSKSTLHRSEPVV